MFLGIRVSQWLSGILILVGIIMVVLRRRRQLFRSINHKGENMIIEISVLIIALSIAGGGSIHYFVFKKIEYSNG